MDKSLKTKLSSIKLLALDVDGVLTDGNIYYSSCGHEIKSFNVKDGYGLRQLITNGIKIAIISARNSKAVIKRAQELGINEVNQGVANKSEALIQLCAKLGVRHRECAFMGDDLPDIDAMKIAGVKLSVADAAQEVIDMSDWISKKPGGKGAVREACEMILRSVNT